MYVQSMYMKCITNLIVDLALTFHQWITAHKMAGECYRRKYTKQHHPCELIHEQNIE
jgi:hypothetical protein